MIESVRNYLLNKQYALFLGVAGTLLASGEEFAEWVNIVATENNDWTVTGLLPLFVAIATRFRVSSNETIAEIKDQLA
jgi:hypothetical protein